MKEENENPTAEGEKEENDASECKTKTKTTANCEEQPAAVDDKKAPVLQPITAPSHKPSSNRPPPSPQKENLQDPTMPSIETVTCPKSVMKDLMEPHFNMWRLDRDSMVDHLEYMYHDLGISQAWNIPRSTLRMFLFSVRERYQDNPYHNFKHCFSVAQMTYSIICKLGLSERLAVDDIGAVLTAAICHDVDHPGVNNAYHIHAQSTLAILYDYESVLEQHHFAVACRILANKQTNIFRNVINRAQILHKIGELIIATDLAKHKELVTNNTLNFEMGFDYENEDHVIGLLKIVIKCADISNEVRPEKVATPWVERLFAEFSLQFAREKRESLPESTFMDPEKLNVPEAQEGFIRGLLLPMYSELCKINAEAREVYVTPLQDALTRYIHQKKEEANK